MSWPPTTGVSLMPSPAKWPTSTVASSRSTRATTPLSGNNWSKPKKKDGAGTRKTRSWRRSCSGRLRTTRGGRMPARKRSAGRRQRLRQPQSREADEAFARRPSQNGGGCGERQNGEAFREERGQDRVRVRKGPQPRARRGSDRRLCGRTTVDGGALFRGLGGGQGGGPRAERFRQDGALAYRAGRDPGSRRSIPSRSFRERWLLRPGHEERASR